MTRLRFEMRHTFSWAHLVGLAGLLIALLPGVLSGAGVSFFGLLRYLELTLPLIAALLAVNLLSPEANGNVTERVAATAGGLRSILVWRAGFLALYLGAVILTAAGVALGYLGNLQALPHLFLFAFVPSSGFVALALYALARTGSAATALAIVSLLWGGALMLSAFATRSPLSYLSPFGYFAGYPLSTVWFGKGLWVLLAILFFGLCLRELKHPHKLLTE